MEEHPLLRALGQFKANLPEARPWAAKDTIIREGDEPRFFLLVSGSVEVTYTSTDGVQLTAKLFSAPAAFGEVECITQNLMQETVCAVQACELISLDQAAFAALCDQSPAFTKALLWDVGQRFEICIQNERLLGFGRANARLVNFLLSSVRAHGEALGLETIIRREHSQESLAAAIGLNRRSVTRGIELLTREGVLRKEGRHFVVCSLSKLEAMAGDEAAMLHYRIED